MNNTLENKGKFFAQYWGQEVAIQNDGGGTGFVYDINEYTITDIRYDFLELTPLSQISDEDAIDVAKLNVYRYSDGRRSTYYEHYLNVMGENPVEYVKSILINTVHWDELSLKCYDFLRSKGYALPWMGLSVEQLVEYGWVKLKVVNNEE